MVCVTAIDHAACCAQQILEETTACPDAGIDGLTVSVESGYYTGPLFSQTWNTLTTYSCTTGTPDTGSGKCCISIGPTVADPSTAPTVDGKGGGNSGGTLAIGAYKATYAWHVPHASPGLTKTASWSSEFQIGVPEWSSYPAMSAVPVNSTGGGTTGGALPAGWYAVKFQLIDQDGGHTNAVSAYNTFHNSEDEYIYGPAFYVDGDDIPRLSFSSWGTSRPNAASLKIYLSSVTAVATGDEDDDGNPYYDFTYGAYNLKDTLAPGTNTYDILDGTVGAAIPSGRTTVPSIARATIPALPGGVDYAQMWAAAMPQTPITVARGAGHAVATTVDLVDSGLLALPLLNSTHWTNYKVHLAHPPDMHFDRCWEFDWNNKGVNCTKQEYVAYFCEVTVTWHVQDHDSEAGIEGITTHLDTAQSHSSCDLEYAFEDLGGGDYQAIFDYGYCEPVLGPHWSFCGPDRVPGITYSGSTRLDITHPDYFDDFFCCSQEVCGVPGGTVDAGIIDLYKRARRGGNWVLHGGIEASHVTGTTYSPYSPETYCIHHHDGCCGPHCAEADNIGADPTQVCDWSAGLPNGNRERRGDIVNITLYGTFTGAAKVTGAYNGVSVPLYWDDTTSDGQFDPLAPVLPEALWDSGCLAASGAFGYPQYGGPGVYAKDGCSINVVQTGPHLSLTYVYWIWFVDLDNPIFYQSARMTYRASGGLRFENFWGTDCTDTVPPTITPPDLANIDGECMWICLDTGGLLTCQYAIVHTSDYSADGFDYTITWNCASSPTFLVNDGYDNSLCNVDPATAPGLPDYAPRCLLPDLATWAPASPYQHLASIPKYVSSSCPNPNSAYSQDWGNVISLGCHGPCADSLGICPPTWMRYGDGPCVIGDAGAYGPWCNPLPEVWCPGDYAPYGNNCNGSLEECQKYTWAVLE